MAARREAMERRTVALFALARRVTLVARGQSLPTEK